MREPLYTSLMVRLSRLISAVGFLLVVAASAQALVTVTRSGGLLEASIDLLLKALPGLVLIYVGIWIPQSTIAREYYPRIVAWLGGGVGVMFAFLVLRELHPGVTVQWSPGTQAIALAIGSIGGLLIGVRDAQVLTQAEQLEDRNDELAARETELKQQNERLDEFANMVSHDLRNPLNVADGRLELVAADYESDHVDEIRWALDRMNVLIDDVLTLARSGEDVDELEPVELDELIESCWRNVETKQATLETDAEVRFLADRSRCAQLLENLLRNAIDHGGADVQITIGALDDDRGFSVEDNGPGIPADDRERILEKGYSTADNGTGLGLAIVAEIAAAHDWQLRVTESSSGGARFEITGIEFVDE